MNCIASVFRVLCFALCVTLFTLSANATTYYVTVTGKNTNPGTPTQPFLTIQKAVSAAASGDTVLVADGTYTGTGNHDINFGGHNITLQSVNGPTNCIIDCQKSGRGFYFNSGEGVNAKCLVQGFTVKNGVGKSGTQGQGGAVSVPYGTPTIVNCVFIGNSAAIDGGAMYACSATNCTFINNTVGTASASQGQGGAMNGGVATNCTFIGNSAGYSGGGIEGSGSINCLFTGNTAAYGGAAHGSSLTRCIFTGNSATYGGAQCIATRRRTASLPAIRQPTAAEWLMAWRPTAPSSAIRQPTAAAHMRVPFISVPS